MGMEVNASLTVWAAFVGVDLAFAGALAPALVITGETALAHINSAMTTKVSSLQATITCT